MGNVEITICEKHGTRCMETTNGPACRECRIEELEYQLQSLRQHRDEWPDMRGAGKPLMHEVSCIEPGCDMRWYGHGPRKGRCAVHGGRPTSDDSARPNTSAERAMELPKTEYPTITPEIVESLHRTYMLAKVGAALGPVGALDRTRTAFNWIGEITEKLGMPAAWWQR